MLITGAYYKENLYYTSSLFYKLGCFRAKKQMFSTLKQYSLKKSLPIYSQNVLYARLQESGLKGFTQKP